MPKASPYIVRVVRSRRPLRQRWHVRIEHSNGEIICWTEKYRDRSHAEHIAAQLVAGTGAKMATPEE